jgi:membrane-associated phospholipid phosphatase
MVIQWNDVLLDAVRVGGTAPPLAARNMAMVQVAVYDAVNSIYQTHEPYAVNLHGPRGASAEAAVASAAFTTLSALYPSQLATFQAAYDASLLTIPDGRAENQGVALGRSVAQTILALRANDGANHNVPYTIGTNPGDWQPTPPAFQHSPVLPQWPGVTPFTMTSGSQFRPSGPPSLTSGEYAASFDQVKSLGDKFSTTRTADQTQIAFFWADGAGTVTPPGHWNEIAQDVAMARHNTLAQNARLFALLDLALADAGISAWDAKYHFNYWRPVTAIQHEDPSWLPLITTPPFPSYTSGHSTFSSAAAAVLGGFYGSDAISFSTTTEGLPGVTRYYGSFSSAAAEAGMSRIYGGIHWSFDNEDALQAGSALGQYVVANYLNPIALSHPLFAIAARNGTHAASLSQAQVSPILAEALRRVAASGLDTRSLGNINVRIADLGGRTLSLSAGNTIMLDDNAAGWGWFVDPTPRDNSEFRRRGNQGEKHHIDLLTALEFEIRQLLHHRRHGHGAVLAPGERWHFHYHHGFDWTSAVPKKSPSDLGDWCS